MSKFVEDGNNMNVLVCEECGQKLILFGFIDEDDIKCGCGGRRVLNP